jgi:hypothetical protein
LRLLTSLWWTKVFAWSRGTWAGSTGLFNAQSASLNNLSLKAFLSGISLLGSDHLDEAEATGLLGVWVKHDLALLDVTVLLKETSDLLLGKAWVNSGNKEVGTWVNGTIIIGWSAATTTWTTDCKSDMRSCKGKSRLTGSSCGHLEMQNDDHRVGSRDELVEGKHYAHDLHSVVHHPLLLKDQFHHPVEIQPSDSGILTLITAGTTLVLVIHGRHLALCGIM